MNRGIGVVREEELKMEELKDSHTLGGTGEWGTVVKEREGKGKRREVCVWEVCVCVCVEV